MINFKTQMASRPWKMVILNHKWHPDHREYVFKTINGIRNIDNVFNNIDSIQKLENVYFKKHKWHPEHRKLLFSNMNGIQNIENVNFKAYMTS